MNQSVYGYPYSPLELAADALRALAVVGKKVHNPIPIFQKELRASLSDDQKSFKPNSYFGHMMSDEFKALQNDILMVADHFRKDANRDASELLEPEDVLAELIRSDNLSVVAECPSSYYDWDSNKLSAALFRCQYFLDDHVEYPYPLAFHPRLRNMDYNPFIIISNCEKLFGHQALVPNPLVLARAQEHADKPTSAGVVARNEALEQLDGLSTRVWHMATQIDPYLLEARLMLQPDTEQSDLQVILDYRSLYSEHGA
jgi:hypothetical protein